MYHVYRKGYFSTKIRALQARKRITGSGNQKQYDAGCGFQQSIQRFYRG